MEMWQGFRSGHRRQTGVVDTLRESLRNHVERGHRLYWLEACGDDYLEELCTACSCLIAASYGEGFGLLLIAAARQKLPIIARDLSVFRELTGQHDFYFGGRSGIEFGAAMREMAIAEGKRGPATISGHAFPDLEGKRATTREGHRGASAWTGIEDGR